MRFVWFSGLVFLMVVFPNLAFGQDFDLGKSRISPASPLYFLKSVREALEIKFAGTAYVKTVRELEFADRRIREVNSLVKTPKEDLIQPTLEKYWAGLQRFKKAANLKDGLMLETVNRKLMIHMEALQKVYPQLADLKAKRSVRTTVYKLSQWQEQLIDELILFGQPDLARAVIKSGLSACHLLSKEASSSALNEVEKGILTERADWCFQNLSSSAL